MCETSTYDLHVRGEIPPHLCGSLVVAGSRRDKDRRRFSRWQDSQADLVRIDLTPGRPGRATAHVLEVDPSGADLGLGFRRTEFDERSFGTSHRYGYATQPNHGLNVSDTRVWATNLLFGSPLEVDIQQWKPTRILRYLNPSDRLPRVSGTSHFAWSLDGRHAFFHESLLCDDRVGQPAYTAHLQLVRIDKSGGGERIWELLPPIDDDASEAANFHSIFYFEEDGRAKIGMLRTGAVVEHLEPHIEPSDHTVKPSPASTIWIVELDDDKSQLRAHTLPGIRELDGITLSHLDVDASSRQGFLLYANYKEADVAEETHGDNVYGETADEVSEHYSGMTVQPLAPGQVIRVHYQKGNADIKVFRQHYDAGRTSLGHTWLPINIRLDESGKHLFCTFAGCRPRLLSRHIAAAYRSRAIDPDTVWYVPPLLMRLDAETLRPEYNGTRDFLSYAEPVAMCVVGSSNDGFVCTFSPEVGLRIYRADNLSVMVGHVNSHPLWHWHDTHFHPEPAHMVFVRR